MKKFIVFGCIVTLSAVMLYIYSTYPWVQGVKDDALKKSNQFRLSIKERTWKCKKGTCLGQIVRFDGSKNQFAIRNDTIYSCDDSNVCTKMVGILVDEGPLTLCIKVIDSNKVGCYW